jgi:hypothetical protein
LPYLLWQPGATPNFGPFFRPACRPPEKSARTDGTTAMSRSKFAAPFVLLFALAWLFGQIGLKLFCY